MPRLIDLPACLAAYQTYPEQSKPLGLEPPQTYGAAEQFQARPGQHRRSVRRAAERRRQSVPPASPPGSLFEAAGGAAGWAGATVKQLASGSVS